MIVAEVVRARLRLARNFLWPRRREKRHRGARSRSLVALGLGTAFALFVFASLAALFVQLDSMGLGTARAGAALALVFAAAVTGLVVFDLHYAVSTLLLDSDLTLLRRAPLSSGQLLALKLADSLPRTCALLGVLALPAALAFALSHPLPLWAWPLLPVQLAGLWAVPLGLGLCGALLLVRAVPARRAREILALLSTLFLVLLWMVNSFVLPRFISEDEALAERLSRVLEPAPWVTWTSPPHWAGSALAAAAEGDLVRALLWTALLVLGGTLSLTIAARVTRALLDETMARVAVDPAVARRDLPARLHADPATGWRALLIKDARLFARDWTVLGDVIAAALLWTLLPLVASPVHAAGRDFVARTMLIALTVGLGYEVGARAVPFERAALAWTRLAPVPPLRWSLAKLASGAALSLPLLLIATIAVRLVLRVEWTSLLEACVAALSGLTLALAAGLWTGWAFGDPRWTNPRAMLTLAGRITATALLLLQAGVWLAVLAMADQFRDSLPAGIHLWGPPLLALVLSGPFLWLAAERMRNYEWTG